MKRREPSIAWSGALDSSLKATMPFLMRAGKRKSVKLLRVSVAWKLRNTSYEKELLWVKAEEAIAMAKVEVKGCLCVKTKDKYF